MADATRPLAQHPPVRPRSPEPSSLGPLGALAIAVGLGALGAYMLDLHAHTCDRCGRRWRHFGAFNLGDEQSHTCARCGQVQWWKCGAPHVLRGSLFVDPTRAYPPPPAEASRQALPPPHFPAAPVLDAAGLPRVETPPRTATSDPAGAASFVYPPRRTLR